MQARSEQQALLKTSQSMQLHLLCIFQIFQTDLSDYQWKLNLGGREWSGKTAFVGQVGLVATPDVGRNALSQRIHRARISCPVLLCSMLRINLEDAISSSQ